VYASYDKSYIIKKEEEGLTISLVSVRKEPKWSAHVIVDIPCLNKIRIIG
jgi:O-glycosyl hydrolase